MGHLCHFLERQRLKSPPFDDKEDVKSESASTSLKVLPPWMIKQGMNLTKEHPCSGPYTGRFLMKVQCVIFYGLIPMTDMDGEYLLKEQGLPLDRIFLGSSTTRMGSL